MENDIKTIIKMKKEKADPYLALFPLYYRGPATNFVLKPIREGREEIDKIVFDIIGELSQREKWSPLSGSALAMKEHVYDPLIWPFIEYYIFYEKLSQEIKEKLKKEVMKDFWDKKNEQLRASTKNN